MVETEGRTFPFLDTPRKAFDMKTFRLQFIAMVAAGIVLVLAAVARGSDGDPFILGTGNQADNVTYLQGDLEFTHGRADSLLLGDSCVGSPCSILDARNDGCCDIAISADGADGTALRTVGKVQFTDRSGKVTIPAGQVSTKVSLQNPIDASSFLIATVQQNIAGIYVRGAVANVASNSCTIYLSKAPTQNVKVGWMVLN